MNDMDYAQSIVEHVIGSTFITPLLKQAEVAETEPDWLSIHNTITAKYNDVLADNVIIDAKVNWYKFLITQKKQSEYYSQFIDYKIKQIEKNGVDTAKSGSTSLNNIVYEDMFLHSNDNKQLNIGLKWMKMIIDRKQINDSLYPNWLDTYASMLYKTGKTSEALKWEQKALEFAISKKNNDMIPAAKKTIKKMKAGERIWEEKEYQN